MNLTLHHVKNFEEDLELHSWGFLEPKKHCTLVAESISLILVPGIVFDQNRHRLGYGLGYYDRLLANFQAKTIGIGFQECLFQRDLPILDSDISLNELALF